MKWNYKEKKRLHAVLHGRASLIMAEAVVAAPDGEATDFAVRVWGEYVDRLGCKRITRTGYCWSEEKSTGLKFEFYTRLYKKGYVHIGCPLLSTSHVLNTRDEKSTTRILLVPEELAEKILVLGVAPP